jgi:hypothetical protein
MKTGLQLITLLVSVLAALPAAAAESLPIGAFFGKWEGSAIGQRVTTPTIGYGTRDMDVTVSGTEQGFEITWVTVIRLWDMKEGDESHRRSSTAKFVKNGPSSFVAEGAEGPGANVSHSWARIDERSLIVYVFEIDPDGIYDLSRYARTISESGVMDLTFTRIRDGQTVRRVTGSLLPAHN